MEEMTTTLGTGQDVQAAAAETQAQQAAAPAQEKVTALQKFINGLFGGGSGTEGAAKEDARADDAADVGEKAFTQADLDAAIEAARKQWEDDAAEAERMKRLPPDQRAAEEQRKKDSEIEDLKRQLLRKELREDAARVLEKEGIPAGLADVLDYSSRERMEETLKNTTGIFKESLAGAVQTRLKGKTPEGLGGAASSENLLRDQIARNIRGL
ncbi:MAG: DUF4355 domain-containing protein [Lachnospiraceae bacterium]|nr:DUF4355 domain-containing protein [Lachnospiraceae bacterium]MCM1240982.1 DUF4355 domain-containing protein [Lachnospiraceae bacterium]